VEAEAFDTGSWTVIVTGVWLVVTPVTTPPLTVANEGSEEVHSKFAGVGIEIKSPLVAEVTSVIVPPGYVVVMSGATDSTVA
jgi:hypothetical protein